MRALFHSLVAVLVVAGSADAGAAESGDPPSGRESLCDRVACRGPVTVRLAAGDGTVLEGELPRRPYVLDGVVNVLAGESVSVEASDTGDRFLDLHYVEAVADLDRTLTLSLEQVVSVAGNEMIFSFENPLSRPVKFRLAANQPGTSEFVYQSTCPVAPGGWAFERWPQPIAQLVVFDLQILDGQGSVSASCD
ncbi:MAG: hypothetical protein HKM95_01985 [Inquilinus sp.]|nr:hypothetical protein [Inquilinus sp.]